MTDEPRRPVHEQDPIMADLEAINGLAHMLHRMPEVFAREVMSDHEATELEAIVSEPFDSDDFTEVGRPEDQRCICSDRECLICDHEGCGWCPDCSPGVPDL